MTPLPEKILGAGAECVPDPEQLKSDVESLYAAASNGIKRSASLGIAAGHNIFTAYCIQFMMFATGHRPCSDPFERLAGFCESEQFWIINDKVTTPRHANRVIYLPKSAIKQLQRYLVHLDGLARRLSEKGASARKVAHAIVSVLERRKEVTIPLFFFLSDDLGKTLSITPERLKAVCGDAWSQPVRAHRYCIGSDLACFGVSHDLINLQLGHLPILSHPLGPSGALSPAKVGTRLFPALEKLVGTQGWRVLGGFGCQRLRQVRLSPIVVAPRVHEVAVYGELRRAQEREARIEPVGEIVDRLLMSRHPMGFPDVMDQQESEALKRAAIEASGEQPDLAYAVVLELLRRMDAARRSGKKIWIPGRLQPLYVETGPFDSGFPTRYEETRAFRVKFIELLAERARPNAIAPFYRRLGEIVVSAAINGALLDAEYLKRLPFALDEPTCWVADCLRVVFLDDSKREERHWVADPTTEKLIAGFKKSHAGRNQNISSTAVDLEVGKILADASFPIRDRRQKNDNVLVSLARDYWTWHLPGHLFSVAATKLPNASLQQKVMARLITGNRLKADTGALEDQGEVGVAWTSKQKSARSIGSGARFLASLKTIYQEIDQLPPVGKNLRDHNRIDTLAESVRAILDGKQGFSNNVHLAGSWIVYLCERGTITTKYLHYSTIQDYVALVVKPLLDLFPDDSLLEMDDEQIVETYSAAIEYFTERIDKTKVVGRLREFHAFLQREWGVGGIDFSELYADARNSAVECIADANLITPREYEAALNWLAEDQEVASPIFRQQLIVLMTLGYRFGVRFSEAWRAQIRDIHIDDTAGEWILEVRPSVHGELKTNAARRVVQALGTPLEIETKALRRMLAEHESQQGDHAALLLYREGGNVRDLIDRSTATFHIHRVLRMITGDPSVRFHHLRHSWVNRMYAEMTVDWADPSTGPLVRLRMEGQAPGAVTWREYWTGQQEPLVDMLSTIEVGVGHASIGSTVASYLHVLDWRIGEMVNPHASAKLTDELLGYMLGEKRNTVTHRRLRGKSDRQTSRRRASGRGVRKPLVDELYVMEPLPCLATGDQAAKARGMIDLRLIDRVLRMMSRNPDRLHEVAEFLGLASHHVERVVAVAEELEFRSGYDDYRLDHIRWLSSEELADEKCVGHPTKRVLELIVRAEEMAKKNRRAGVEEFIYTWADVLHHGIDRNRWLLASPKQLKLMVNGLVALGIPKTALCLVFEREHIKHGGDKSEFLSYEANEILDDLGIEAIHTSETLVNAGRWKGARAIAAVSLLETKEKGVVYPRWVDRAIFLMGISLGIDVT